MTPWYACIFLHYCLICGNPPFVCEFPSDCARRCFGVSLNNLLKNSLLPGDLRCPDAHLTSLWYNAVTYISLISNHFKWCCCPQNESFGPENISNLWIRFSWKSFYEASVIYKCITRCIVKLVRLQFKNPYKMLPTMYIFGNTDTLEIPSTIIDTDAYTNNSLPLCADKVLQRERALIKTLV